MARSRSRSAADRQVRRLAWVLGGLCAVAWLALVLLPQKRGSAAPALPAPPRDERAAAGHEQRAVLPASSPAPTGPQDSATEKERPRVAIVIDDVGYNMESVKDLLEIGLPFTFAIIPRLRYSETAARRVAEEGREVILHQPMEPVEYPGIPLEEGGLLVGMVPSEVERILDENLRTVPGASGVNNHKGSRATQDPELMLGFLTAVRRRHLFFLDSRTSAGTVAEETARRLRIPTGRRNVFLDNDRDVDSILAQLRALLDIARKQGHAIGIGHADPRTIRALELARPWLDDGSVELVPVSSLMT